MKFLIVIVSLFALNSCNTLIGLTRDTRQGYQWTKSKIKGDGDVLPEQSGAPVY
jgi:predicted small secreted protein